MRVSIDDTNAQELERLTGKKLTKNGNEMIAELIEMVEESKRPDTPCWIESSCSDPPKKEDEK